MSSFKYNFDEITKFVGEDKDALKQMLVIFTEKAPETLANLNKAYAENDIKNTNYFAHKLKTSVDLLNITDIKKTIREIEHGALETDEMKSLQEFLDKLNDVLPKVVTAVKSDIDKL